MAFLAPSILSADFSKLGEEVSTIEKAGADFIHVDVMDGHFVPNISYGAVVMKSLLGKTDMPFDVHLMIEDPDKYIGDFMTEQTEYICVHQEACIHMHRTVSHIRELGAKPAVAINPATPVCTIEEILPFVDMVLVMSVNPGFGGQSFIPEVLGKIRKLDEMRKAGKGDFLIEIDGGAGLDNLSEILDAGTDIIVAGSSVFKAADIDARVREMQKIIKG